MVFCRYFNIHLVSFANPSLPSPPFTFLAENCLGVSFAHCL